MNIVKNITKKKRNRFLTCYKHSGRNGPEIEIILRFAHILRQLDLSSKWTWIHGRDDEDYAYMGEEQVARFFYNYFTPHNNATLARRFSCIDQ